MSDVFKPSLKAETKGLRLVDEYGYVCPTGWIDCDYDQDRRGWRLYNPKGEPQPLSQLSAVQLLMAGAIAGTIAKPVVSPLDVVRTRQQVLGTRMRHNNLTQAIRHIYREEGFRGLFKGNGVACARLAPYSGIKFAAFEFLKKHLSDRDGNFSNSGRFMAGGLAGMSAVALTYPLDVVRVRLTVDKESKLYRGAMDALVKISRQEGFLGLYKGIGPTLVGEVLYEGAVFLTYEALKEQWEKFLHRRDANRELGPMDHVVLGSVAGGVAQLLAYPLDVIRKRSMVQAERTSSWSLLVKIIREEGLRSLYKGTGATLLKIVPYAAVMFASYEQAKKLFNYYNERTAQPIPAPSVLMFGNRHAE